MTLGGADNASIREDGTWATHGLFISPEVDNTSMAIRSHLIMHNFHDGAALFGREGEKEITDFRTVCGGLEDLTHDQVATIVQYYVQRLRNYHHLESMAAASIWQARVVADGCDPSHADRIVDVADATVKLQCYRSLSYREYETFVWNEDVGFPPFSIECSCRMEGIIPGVE